MRRVESGLWMAEETLCIVPYSRVRGHEVVERWGSELVVRGVGCVGCWVFGREFERTMDWHDVSQTCPL